MKRLWNILAVLAVANLLGMGGFVLWLQGTGRLSVDRLRAVRAALTPTLTEEAAAAAAAAAAAETADKERKEAARMAAPPESASEAIERQKQHDDATLQTVLRARREIDDLRRQLLDERAKLDGEWAALAADKKAWAAQREDVERLASSKQFKQALTTLEAQKPKDAQQLLKLIHSGQSLPAAGAQPAPAASATGSAQAVAYLAAMQERTRGRVLAEWIKDDPAVAAELLESLRRRGVGEAPRAAAQ